MTDLAAAAQFIASNARLIDRRRFAYLAGDGSAEAVVRALDAYRNADGGIGHIEPDIRAPGSQPLCVRYALDVLHEVGATDLSLATSALDWVQTVTNDDGGVAFVLTSARGWPIAPWFDAQENDPPSSLLSTSGIASMATRIGIEHPWIERAIGFCTPRIHDALGGDAYTMRYVVDLLDAAPERFDVDADLEVLSRRIADDGVLRVEGGAEGEALRPLDLAPRPEHAARRLFSDEVIEHELERLAAGQLADGGWEFDWAHWNPASVYEWRGLVTVNALTTLRAYGRLG
jgi:hypothetical protein